MQKAEKKGLLPDFYPRPPRGGRLCKRPKKKGSCRISIHALREEGDRFEVVGCTHRPISIHALREEGDYIGMVRWGSRETFLSTPSARRATSLPHSTDCGYTISIHALREEGDTPANIGSGRPCDFYPRPPRGGRRLPSCKSLTCRTFLSTPSARRATFSQASTCRSKSFLSTPSARRATS